jgi:hypothetical protein
VTIVTNQSEPEMVVLFLTGCARINNFYHVLHVKNILLIIFLQWCLYCIFPSPVLIYLISLHIYKGTALKYY